MNFLSSLCFSLLKESYQSLQNNNLPPSFINEQIKQLNLSLCSYPSIYVEQVIKIALHLNQNTYTGYYSVKFNHLARSGDSGFIVHAPQITLEEMFPEAYNNSFLSVQEKQHLKKIQKNEYTALKQAFQLAQIYGIEQIFSSGLYNECYTAVCHTQNFEQTGNFEEFTRPICSSPEKQQLIRVDNEIYSIPTRLLLLNVLTQKLPTLKTIQMNFQTELKLLKYSIKDALSLVSVTG